MKSFLKTFFASTLGVIVGLLLMFFILVGILGALASSMEKTVTVKPNSILVFKFDKQIVEREEINPFEDMDLGGFGKATQEGLWEITGNIAKAKTDDNIKGIYLDLLYVQARYAELEEIRNALIDFKSSGKFIVAYSDYMSQGAYYLASVASKIYLNPAGGIDFGGIRSEVMFLKGTLEKLGIEAQVIRHGKYKSAVEPFTNDKLSPENREQISTLIGSLWQHTISGISAHRNISENHLKRLANSLVLMTPDSCISNGIADSLIYKDQVIEILNRLSGNSEKKPITISHSQYKKVPAPYLGKGLAKNKIAVVYASGDVVLGNEGEGAIASDRISQAIRTARTDTSVRAIVFRINSPGGSALASEVIWREVALAAKEKPVVASMSGLAASGGYYIACAANTIMVQPNTITGSIGVFGVMFNAKQLLNQKLGITTDVVKTNEHSDFPTISRSMDTYEKNFMQSQIDRIYDNFISHVADGRNMDRAKVENLAQGRIWTGSDAVKLGLADTIGGLNNAIELAAKLANISDHYRLNHLPKLDDPFEKFFKNVSEQTRTWLLEAELGENYNNYMQYKTIKNLQGIQARMPFFNGFY